MFIGYKHSTQSTLLARVRVADTYAAIFPPHLSCSLYCCPFTLTLPRAPKTPHAIASSLRTRGRQQDQILVASEARHVKRLAAFFSCCPLDYLTTTTQAPDESMRRVGCTLLETSNRLRPHSSMALRRSLATASRLENEMDTQLSSSRASKHNDHHCLYYHSSSHHGAATEEETGWTAHQEQEGKDTSSFSREFEKPRMDASFLVNNYTAPALAAAYQDREYTLWLCAELLSEGKLDELEAVLKPYHDFAQHDMNVQRQTPLATAFGQRHLERIRKRLSRLPRQITKAYSARAAVVIPLCTFEGEPSVLFTLRSLTVGKHKGEVCFPGGMVDPNDSCIEGTCLREMNEEVGLAPECVDVLGVLRCDWSSVTSITGIAVTPVVGFIGEMSDQTVAINEDEVESLFTVPLRDLMNQDNWIRHSNATPVFTGGPHVIWGLTAYLLDICLSEVLKVSE